MAAGVWLHLSYRGYATLLPDHLILSADTLFLSVGAVGLVTSFLGCCGAWLQSRCLLALVNYSYTLSLTTRVYLLF